MLFDKAFVETFKRSLQNEYRMSSTERVQNCSEELPATAISPFSLIFAFVLS